MEKQFNREEELIKKLLNEAGSEKPSANFKSRIMANIEAKKAPVKAYKPLIPRAAWYVVGIVLILAMGGLYFQFTDFSIDLPGTSAMKFQIPKINLPNIHFSKTTQYAIAFVALFFLQIPFLKKYIDRQYGG